MIPRDKILRETSPLSIFLVKSGSGGNRLLFRYPYDDSFQDDPGFGLSHESMTSDQDRLQLRNVINENDEALCNMFSVNPNLCGQKFEIKINSVRHVGHPMSLLPPTMPANIHSASSPAQSSTYSNQQHHHRQACHHPANLSLSSFDSLTAPASNHNNQGDITSFNILCALRATASFDIVDCYHDLSKRLAIALSFEERRCSFLSKEIKTVLATLEENDMASLADHDQQDSLSKKVMNTSGHDSRDSRQSVFAQILRRSILANDLKKVFISLTLKGIVDLKINNWVNVSFCLPQKVHRLKLITHKSMPAISTRDIKRCLLYLRPYHGLLLLYEPAELLESLPIDASPAFIQLIKVTKPDKNFMDLSVDANLTLMQIFCIVSQLIYWAKATVIYPICDSNIYAIHPLASTGTQSKLVSDFKTRFPNSKSIHHYLADFSEGTSLSQLNGPLLNIEEKLNLHSIVTWLLQRRILIQVHKYIFLVVDKAPTTAPSDSLNFQDTPNQNSSPRCIDITVPNSFSSQHNRLSGMKLPGKSIDSSPQIFKNSFSESLESSSRRFRADSLAESQDDANFGLNSSLSSTPNSNLEYPSPSNDVINRSSLSSSCPLDNPLGFDGTGSIVSALQRAGLSLAGIKSILAVPAIKTHQDEFKLLVRLVPYFNGKHHIEDIMFFENLPRTSILMLCDMFRDVLFISHYEDTAVSLLSPFEK